MNSENEKKLTEIAQEITEEHFGTGDYKEEWKQGDDVLKDRHNDWPIKWTTIECGQCGNQVYFDKIMRRHRCCECGYGF